MSFACRPNRLAAGPVGAWSGLARKVVSTPTLATAQVSVNTDGSLSGTNYSGDAKWYEPTGGTPGNSYWVKFTIGGGDDAWSTGLTAGTVYALSSNRSVTWSTNNSVLVATLTVSIYADSGGTQLVGTGTVTVRAEST